MLMIILENVKKKHLMIFNKELNIYKTNKISLKMINKNF